MRFQILQSENDTSGGENDTLSTTEIIHNGDENQAIDSQFVNGVNQLLNANHHSSPFLSNTEPNPQPNSHSREESHYDEHFIQVYNNYSNQFEPHYLNSFNFPYMRNSNSSSDLNPDSDSKMMNQSNEKTNTFYISSQIERNSSPSRKRTQQNDSNMDYAATNLCYSPVNMNGSHSPFSKRNRGYLHNVVITHHICDLAPEILSYILQYLDTYDLFTCARPICKKFRQFVDQDSELCANGFEIPTNVPINLNEQRFLLEVFSKRVPSTWRKVVFVKQHFLSLSLFEKIFTECNSLEQVVIKDCHQFQESSIPLLLNMASKLKKLEIHSSSGLMSPTRRSHTTNHQNGSISDEKDGWGVISDKPLPLTCLRLTNFKSTSSVVRMISENLLPHLKELKISRPPVNSIKMSHMDAMTNKLSDLEHFELALPLYATDFNHNSSLLVVDSLVQALLIKNVPLVYLSLEGVSCSIKTFVNIFSYGLALEHLAIDLHTNTLNIDRSASLIDNEEFFKPLDRLKSVRIRLDDKNRTHNFNNSLIVKYCLPSVHLKSIELSKIVLTDYTQFQDAFSHCKYNLRTLKLVGTFLPNSLSLYHLTLNSNRLKFSELSSSNIKCPLIRSLVIHSRSIIDQDVQHICLIFNSLSALTLDSMQLTSDIFYHISNFGQSIVTLNIFSNIAFEPPKTLSRNSNSFLRNIYFYSWKEVPLRMYNMLQIAFPRYQYKRNTFFSHNESLSIIEQSLIMKYIEKLILETFSKEKSILVLSDHNLLEKLYEISLKVLSLQIISENCIIFESQLAKDKMIDELKIPFQFLLSLFENVIYSEGKSNENLQHFLNRLFELPFKELEDSSKYTFNTISHELT